MAIEIKVPPLPESVSDATIVTWHKKLGEHVKRDENLVDLETDKVILEVPAPQEGVLEEILKNVGDVVIAQELIARLKPHSVNEKPVTDSSPDTSKVDKIKTDQATLSHPGNEKPVMVCSANTTTAIKTMDDKVAPFSPNQSSSISSGTGGPSARRAAAEKGIEINNIMGSGKNNRVTREDVKQALPLSVQASSNASFQAGRIEERVAMSRLRARVAERLKTAQQTAVILTTFNEVNLQKVMELRNKYKEAFEKQHGARLGFMSFFTKAAIEALKRFPEVNASIDGQNIVYHSYYDIGIAVSSERGLVVPIVRNAEQLSFAGLEKAVADYAKQARDGHLTIESMTGGTFTLTNGGVFGSLLSTPILNPPQSAILGMHKIEERVIVENGQMVIRPMMYLALSYDHRIVDGKTSVSFLVAIKESLEDPARLLLGI